MPAISLIWSYNIKIIYWSLLLYELTLDSILWLIPHTSLTYYLQFITYEGLYTYRHDTYCKSECFTFSKCLYQQHKPLFEASCTNLFVLHLAHYYFKIIWQGNNVCPMVVVVQDMWSIKNLYWAIQKWTQYNVCMTLTFIMDNNVTYCWYVVPASYDVDDIYL